MIASVWLLLSSLFYSLQLHSGSFPKPLSAEEERHYLELSAQGDLEKHSGGTKPAAGGPCDEKQMMQGEIFCGGQKEARCLCAGIGLRKFTGKRCLTNKGQAWQGFDACRALSLYGGQVKKADAGFVDAQGSILTGRIFVAFRAKLWYDETRKGDPMNDIATFGNDAGFSVFPSGTVSSDSNNGREQGESAAQIQSTRKFSKRVLTLTLRNGLY